MFERFNVYNIEETLKKIAKFNFPLIKKITIEELNPPKYQRSNKIY
jgi:hypothetical protein